MLTAGPAREQDRGPIIELTRRTFGDDFAAQLDREWHWQWHADPRLAEPGYRGVVVREGERIVGTTALLPAGLHVAGVPVDAWWQVCTAVDEHCRRRGVGALLQQRMEAHSILAKGPSEGALALFKSTGYQVVDFGGYWTRTLDFKARLQRSTGGGVGGALGSLANAFIESVPEMPSGVTELSGDFDASFDALWESARKQYPAITRRDAAVLNWRYRRKPFADYTVLVLENRGYLTFSDFERRGILRGRIVDVLAGRDDEDARRDLIAGALHALHERGADRVDCLATSPVVRESLRAAGFSPAKRPDPLVMRGIELDEPYFCAGDGDGA